MPISVLAARGRWAVAARGRGAVVLGAALLSLGAPVPAASAMATVPLAPAFSGQVVAWGAAGELQDTIRPPAGLDDVVMVAASDAPGSYSSLALRSDGTVVGWGLNRYGEADPPEGLHSVVAIDSGAGFSLALHADGSVATWGADDTGQLDVPADLGPVTAISAGGYFGYGGIGVPQAVCGYALALRPDGTVVRWGRNREGLGCDLIDSRMDPPVGLTDVVAVSAGSVQALALRSDGTVVGWGQGVTFGDGIRPELWSDVVAISAGTGNSLGLRADGTVLAYGIWGEAGPPRLQNAASVSASTVDLFLGRDTTISSYPTQTGDRPADAGYLAVSAGEGYSLAIHAVQEPLPWIPPLGSAEVQPWVDSNPAGTAEAFQYTASRDASVSTLHLHLDASNAARTLVVGVYRDDHGRPGTLLSTGTSRDPVAGQWNAIPISTTQIEAGQRYWLALLGPKDTGLIRFRDLPSGTGGPAIISRQTNLTSSRGLPASWTSGTRFTSSPASAYLS
ncbi:choice-of-anchor R domain-containing protein [Pedococcus sp. 5OH_020]|uniref:choice-of-anchor R domain-containing protein n=1 Tax=Pedococcus sp. 5OH_020 TaxID=2989814 RepID=UPI0022E9D2DB|nr:choice-of-anchor R domain-containing protein [Pedococcus sp. 5OH_020]